MKQIVFVGLFLALFATSVQSPQQSATSNPDSIAGKASIAGNAKDAKRIAIPVTVVKTIEFT